MQKGTGEKIEVARISGFVLRDGLCKVNAIKTF